ncbi:MAG: PKD domain-containing protein [Clostridiaceae bacterium]|nr:PKD domain-containing protein [Clostridiaceae bacterium]
MFCKHCGRQIQEQAQFCPHCGQAVRRGETARQPVQPSTAYPMPTPAWPQPSSSLPAGTGKKRFTGAQKLMLAIGGLLVVIVLVAIMINLLHREPSAWAADAKLLAEQKIGAAGGTVEIDNPQSALDGLRLEVPAGAYEQDLKYSILETPAAGLDYGDLFHPATPVITIDNGHGFAGKPMTLKIPVQIAADEFAMAFFRDRATGSLEGIPCLEQDERSITIETAHFSDVIVSIVKKNLLDGRIMDNEADTNFMPAMSDFYAPNYGSFAEPGGHCGGQSMAMIHYYNMHANDNADGRTLRTEEGVDNNTLPATRDFWQDDSLAYRLCSRVQRDFIWDNSVIDPQRDQYDDVTYYSFAYSMALTHSPQLVFIYRTKADGTTGGHALVVYGVTPDGLAIADPNYPGDLLRRIDVRRGTDAGDLGLDLLPYSSAARSGDSAVVYDRISYYGLYALMNHDVMDQLWQDVIDGQDVGGALFPADLSLIAAAGRDAGGILIVSPLTSSFSISRLQTEQVDAAKAGEIHLTVPVVDADARLSFYNGTTLLETVEGTLGQDAGKYMGIALQPGINDIGVLYERRTSDDQFAYVNFYRYQITYSAVSLSVEPAAAEIQAGEAVRLAATLNGDAGSVSPLLTWDFGDGSAPVSGDALIVEHTYSQGGVFTGTVILADAAAPGTELGRAVFTVTAAAAATETNPPAAGMGGSWMLNYIYDAECQHTSSLEQMSHNLHFEETDHLGKNYSYALQLGDSAFRTDDGVTYTIVIPDFFIDNTFTGALSADGRTVEGTFVANFGTQKEHWINGRFTLTRSD